MPMTLLAIVGLSCSLTTAELSKNAEKLGLPIVFTHEANLKTHSGFLPVKLAGGDSGVETYYIDDPKALASLPPNKALQQDKSAIIEFRWGGNFQEGATALYIGYILGKACNAVLFETTGGDYVPANEALQGAEVMVSMGQSR